MLHQAKNSSDSLTERCCFHLLCPSQPAAHPKLECLGGAIRGVSGNCLLCSPGDGFRIQLELLEIGDLMEISSTNMVISWDLTNNDGSLMVPHG